MTSLPTRFTVRVYGLLQNLQEKVLLSHEAIGSFTFIKFPGGGLELGEGPEDGVKREFREESGLSVDIQAHIYTTGFFIQSQIDPEEQVIAIYYLAGCSNGNDCKNISLEEHSFDFRGQTNRVRLAWHEPAEVAGLLTFESDQKAWKVYRQARPNTSLS